MNVDHTLSSTLDAIPCPTLPYPDEGNVWNALWTPPEIDPTAWVAPGATVFGRVRLKARSSVWYGCVLRGDGDLIEVGEDTNVQDGSILHVDHGFPCILGNRVTLGHRTGPCVSGRRRHDDRNRCDSSQPLRDWRASPDRRRSGRHGGDARPATHTVGWLSRARSKT